MCRSGTEDTQHPSTTCRSPRGAYCIIIASQVQLTSFVADCDHHFSRSVAVPHIHTMYNAHTIECVTANSSSHKASCPSRCSVSNLLLGETHSFQSRLQVTSGELRLTVHSTPGLMNNCRRSRWMCYTWRSSLTVNDVLMFFGFGMKITKKNKSVQRGCCYCAVSCV